MKWKELQEKLNLEGYSEEYGNETDEQVAKETPCNECGGKVDYIPMRKHRSYRAFAVCSGCGNAIEF